MRLPCTIGVKANQLTNISVYPNPTQNEFNYILYSNDKNVTFKVYNLLGELVFTNKVSSNSGIYKGTVDLNNKTDGIYFVIAETESKRITQKIIKE